MSSSLLPLNIGPQTTSSQPPLPGTVRITAPDPTRRSPTAPVVSLRACGSSSCVMRRQLSASPTTCAPSPKPGVSTPACSGSASRTTASSRTPSLSSPLLRARETAAEIAKAVGVDAEADERLAPGADPDDMRAAASDRGETVVVVGHQPDCGRTVAALSGGPEPPFPPGAVVAVEV